ncbi:YncE family protein [Rhodococcus erythropolis]|uniref:YncE family protein n=1 Tax=Rhodococcus erythropolis TaxID=1833 RepID=UPI0037A0D2A8
MAILHRSMSPTRRARLFACAGAAAFAVTAFVAAAGPASADTVTATVPVGVSPGGVAISPDGGRAYVTNLGSDSVSVIDTGTNTVAATVPVGGSPVGVAITPDGGHAYVTNLGSNSVSVIETATNTVAATVPVGGSPAGVAISPDGGRAYVTNLGSNSVSVIEIEQSATLTGLPGAGVVGQPYRHAFTVTGRPAPTAAVTAGALPDGLTLSAEGVLSGTPTTSGRFEFTVTATNGIGDAAVLPVVLDITDTTPPAGPFGSLGSDSLNWTF